MEMKMRNVFGSTRTRTVELPRKKKAPPPSGKQKKHSEAFLRQRAYRLAAVALAEIEVETDDLSDEEDRMVEKIIRKGITAELDRVRANEAANDSPEEQHKRRLQRQK
jgi:hypothetical protein